MDQAERDNLVLGNLKLVQSITNRYNPPLGSDHEDLYQIGCIGLIKASRKYEPEKNVKFSTYAYHCIQNEINLFIRSETKTKKNKAVVVSLDQPISMDGFTLMDTVADSEILEIKLMYRELMNQLEQEADFHLLNKSMLGYPQKEIARLEGRSRSCVSKRINFLREKYRDVVPV